VASALPLPERPFEGVTTELATASEPPRPEIQYPPAGAPNVVVVMYDDVGFWAASTFGGPIPTPAPVLDERRDAGRRDQHGGAGRPYPNRFPFTGRIGRIDIELRPALTDAQRREVHGGQVRAALAGQQAAVGTPRTKET